MARYWVGGTANWDATAGTKWATTSGGAGGAAVPTASDDVFFDANSGAVTVTVTATSVGLSLTFTGFTGTFAGSSGITISGNVTLDAGMTLTYTGMLTISTTSTITSNAVIWSGNIGIGGVAGSFTVTLADDLHIAGTFGIVSAIQLTLNGNKLYVAGNVSVSTGTSCKGTTEVVLNTSTSQSLTTRSDSANFVNKITFDATGTITITNNSSFGCGSLATASTIKYIAGTISTNTVNFRQDAGTTFSIDTSGMTWTNVIFNSNGAVSLLSDLNISGNLTTGGNNINGLFNINVGGSLSVPATTISGTVTIVLNGTGTWSGAGTLKYNLIINTAGTITISGTVAFNTRTLTYTAGTVTTTSSTLSCTLSTTFNTSGMSWNNVTFSNPTITLTSDLNLNGTLTINNTTVAINGAFNINTKSLTMTSASSGTASIVLNGTGTWSGPGAVGNNLTINHAGTTTVSGSVNFGASGKTLTYTAGTVVTTGSTLSNGVTCILNTSGIVWNNFTTSVQGTITNNSLLTVSGTISYTSTGVGVTFAGTAGWTCGAFTCTVAGLSHTFTVGNTYTITSAFTITAATNASRITLRSSSAGTKAIFILNPGATQNVGFVNATDINSNAGQTIYSFNGVITTTFNWSTLNYPRPTGFVFQH